METLLLGVLIKILQKNPEMKSEIAYSHIILRIVIPRSQLNLGDATSSNFLYNYITKDTYLLKNVKYN